MYGLLGRNIGYSLSPHMHNRAFRHFGIDAEYVLFDIPENDLDGFIRDKVVHGAVGGFNITVPYKTKIKEKLEGRYPGIDPDGWVKIVKAVNTVRITDGKPEMWNTDVTGFLSSLNNDLGYDTSSTGSKRSCFIAGAGGAGRAIALFLMSTVESIELYVRDIDDEKLSSLAKDIELNYGMRCSEKFHILGPEEDPAEKAALCDLLVNASPLGTRQEDPLPVPEECIRKDLSVYDLVYARETDLVKKARIKGARAVNGRGMLIRQGAIAFSIWTGMDVNETAAVMEKELEAKWNI